MGWLHLSKSAISPKTLHNLWKEHIMDAFSGLILVVVGFAFGFGAMWAYCRFFLDRKHPTR
jgi:hypothetical protein